MYCDQNEEDGYASCSEIDFEITDNKNGKIFKQTITVPYRPTYCNIKRLLCFSINNGTECVYNKKCNYAHSLSEQIVDDDKYFIYQILLDKNLMNFFSMTNPKTDENYKQLLLMTKVCDRCITTDKNNGCTGGYNCRNGVCLPCLKICKNDLLTGQCLNPIININIDDSITTKFESGDFVKCDQYEGCLNGHHLSTRGLIPYYKFIHQKENSRKNKYQSVRYIDINPLNRIFNQNQSNENFDTTDSDSSTDEEISEMFSNKYGSDSD